VRFKLGQTPSTWSLVKSDTPAGADCVHIGKASTTDLAVFCASLRNRPDLSNHSERRVRAKSAQERGRERRPPTGAN